MKRLSQVQLGKQGITKNFIDTLKSNFKTHENVKVHVLKSAGHDKKNVKEFSEKILNELGKNYTARVIGFTIAVKKWRKPVR
jgi:RNA-binding protein YhbY